MKKLNALEETVIKTIDPVTGNAQFWAVVLPHADLVSTSALLGYGDTPHLHKVESAIKKVEDATWDSVVFRAIISEKYAGYTHEQRGHEDDPAPIKVRGKVMEMITARYYMHSQTISIYCDTYGESFTSCQADDLYVRFGSQLESYTKNKAILRQLKDRYKRWIVEYAKRDVADIRKQLKAIAEFTG